MKLIVGLGNPGKKYTNTRHNVGFMVIDRLANFQNININNKGFKGLYYKGSLFYQSVILLKPTTYMNLSGVSVSSVVSMYKIEPENILIIYDDLDLPLGKIRIRATGSAGGHNGMKSIISSLGNNQNIARLRIGIDRKEENTANYVLSTFSKEDMEFIDKSIDKSCDAIEEFIKTNDILKVMNEFNSS